MKKKTWGVLLTLTVLLAFTGCGNTQKVDDYVTNEGYENSTDDAVSENSQGKIAKEDIKVGVIHLADLTEKGGYSYTHDLGIQGMQKNLGLSDDQIERKLNVGDSDEAAIRKALQECIDDGCNVIFTTSWGYRDVTAEMAEKYPKVYFCHATGNKSNGRNFTNYFGRIYQARYLSGIVAGMNTKTNKIGYVAAMDTSNSEVTGGLDAFAIGVAKVNDKAKIYVSITNSWYDPEKEKMAAQKLIKAGCDVMAQHCDTAYPQTMIQDAGGYGIGYNSDMSKETPDSCLTSVIWNWSAYYTAAVQSIIDGSWDGQNYYGGMAEGLVDITALASFCVEGTQEQVDAARAQILSGACNVFDGQMETNTGEIIGTKDGTLDDQTIKDGINWYYKNIEVVR